MRLGWRISALLLVLASAVQAWRGNVQRRPRGHHVLFQTFPRPSDSERKSYGPSARYQKSSSASTMFRASKLDEQVSSTSFAPLLVQEPVTVSVPVPVSVSVPVSVAAKGLKTSVVAIKSTPSAAAAQVKPAPTPTLSAVVDDSSSAPAPLTGEEKLRLQVQEEFASRGIRTRELARLQEQLSVSMLRKKEMEEKIIREVQTIFPRITEELKKEADRVEQLSTMMLSMDLMLKTKQENLKQEQAVLSQMTELRSKISEEVVALSIDTGISKKTELVKLEETICSDIAACKKNVEAEFTDAKSKLESMKLLVSKLPAAQDPSGNLRYTWTDVEALQTQLLQSMESAKTRDENVRNFMTVFDGATRRREKVLGTAPTLTAKFGLGGAAAKGGPGAAASGSALTAIRSTSLALRDSSNDELSKLAVKAAIKSITAMAAMAVGLMQAAVNYAKSNEGVRSKEVVSETVTAVSEVFQNAGTAWSATSEAWEAGFSSKMPSEEIPSVNDYLSSTSAAVNAIISSQAVKSAWGGIASGATKSTQGVATVGSLLTRKLGEEITGPGRVPSAVAELADGVLMLGQVASESVSRLVSSAASKQKGQ